MQIDEQLFGRIQRTYKSMIEDRRPWIENWREIASYVLPRRYLTLEANNGAVLATMTNNKIYNGRATIAMKVLSSGMLNGITSPARPWFKMWVPGHMDNPDVALWLDDTVARLTMALSMSNFYTSMATVFTDLSCFATGGMLIEEDDDEIFRCYNFALGEYALMQNERGIVDRVSYGFRWRVEQVVNEFGLENCSQRVRDAWTAGGARRNEKVDIRCLIEPNYNEDRLVAAVHKYRKIVWEDKGADPKQILAARGYREWPGTFPRWETIGNDSYGTGPTHDAFADIKQLQHMTKRKAQAMDILISPPMIASNHLSQRRSQLVAGGITFVPDTSQVGMKPAYQIQPPLMEMSNDISNVEIRINEFYYVDLFKMISQLDSVRSATEIDERVEEKLILLGPVLERFQNEALDVALFRVYSIMARKGLLLPVPEALLGENAQIQYTSILADAQRAVGATPVERYISLIGNVAGARQEVLDVPDWDALVRWYGEQIGVPAKLNKSQDKIDAERQARTQQQEGAAVMEAAPGLAQAGKLLSETQVGGGSNALQQIMGA